EYDMPIYSVERLDEQRQFIVQFIHQFIQTSCTDNRNIKFALLVGIHRIAGLPDTIYHSALLSKNYYSDSLYHQLGFTERHVSTLLQDFHIPLKELNKLKKWYGQQVNGTCMFNPYSVLSFLDSNTYEPYWADLVGRGPILDLILEAPLEEQIDFIKLLKKEGIRKAVKTEIDFQTLVFDSGIFYHKLIARGFLSIDKMEQTDGGLVGEIKIPNEELHRYFIRSTLNTFLKNNSELEQIYTNLLFGTLKILKSMPCQLLKKRCKALYYQTMLDSLIFNRESQEVKDSLPFETFSPLINQVEEQMQSIFTDYPLEAAKTEKFKEKLLVFLEAQKKYYRFPIENNASSMCKPDSFLANQLSQLSVRENEQLEEDDFEEGLEFSCPTFN
ncbi:MAG: AAA family ATPase, partial [Gammaproteobacteria bacterium]|nr:AAA family ATPase [Gammaproteobacteria bacterium]